MKKAPEDRVAGNYDVSSSNQSGGITAGFIGQINVGNRPSSRDFGGETDIPKGTKHVVFYTSPKGGEQEIGSFAEERDAAAAMEAHYEGLHASGENIRDLRRVSQTLLVLPRVRVPHPPFRLN